MKPWNLLFAILLPLAICACGTPATQFLNEKRKAESAGDRCALQKNWSCAVNKYIESYEAAQRFEEYVESKSKSVSSYKSDYTYEKIKIYLAYLSLGNVKAAVPYRSIESASYEKAGLEQAPASFAQELSMQRAQWGLDYVSRRQEEASKQSAERLSRQLALLMAATGKIREPPVTAPDSLKNQSRQRQSKALIETANRINDDLDSAGITDADNCFRSVEPDREKSRALELIENRCNKAAYLAVHQKNERGQVYPVIERVDSKKKTFAKIDRVYGLTGCWSKFRVEKNEEGNHIAYCDD